MNTSVRHLVLCSAAASGLLLLSACGNGSTSNDQPAGAATAPSAVPTAPPPASGMSSPMNSGSTMGSPMNGEQMQSPMPTSSAPAAASSSMPASGSTSTSIAKPADAEAFAVSNVVIGDQVAHHKVSKPSTVIPADKSSIYASVETTGKTEGSTLSARWSYVEGSSQLVSSISQSIATSGPAVTTFRIQNPHDWPAGTYKVDIAVDGKAISSRTFEVRAA